ncbi:hypothetical protein Anapl_09482 [Anas platyrhynchos]|uniref:Uncharacterized protein n=1 Tax=Anas platyrhynchos TaxID=8839 RepID=R0LAW8_ANAPL|nr:hypothetical protein Anapl_09482 [Anas platyrhynchos]
MRLENAVQEQPSPMTRRGSQHSYRSPKQTWGANLGSGAKSPARVDIASHEVFSFSVFQFLPGPVSIKSSFPASSEPVRQRHRSLRGRA